MVSSGTANPSTIEYRWLAAEDVTREQLEACARLFSAHYGVWSKHNPFGRAGNVKRTPDQLREVYLPDGTSWAAMASDGEEIVAYAFVIQVESDTLGWVDWVTQLVVDERYRQRGVAKGLLGAVWGFSDRGAWGLVTPNPFAVRALEKATRRRCSPEAIRGSLDALVAIAKQHVSYVAATRPEVSGTKSVVDTGFFVDHSELDAMLERTQEQSGPWLLGRIGEGEEWFAFTLQEQEPFPIDDDELSLMLARADQTVRDAYERMSLDPSHLWAQHTDKEVDFILRQCGDARIESVLDFGCGAGRHALRFAELGYEVVGIDFSRHLVDKARSAAQRAGREIDFRCEDCRSAALDRRFDLGICLYDVVGTFADDKDNEAIIRNLSRMIRIGGKMAMSVMNLDLVKATAKRREHVFDNPDCLLDLPASRVMEATGDIFDPEYFLLDEKDSLVYRKEQFAADERLPAELLVRDRRYSREEIARLCEGAGFRVDLVRCVRAGKWEDGLDPQDRKAKEVLVVATKVSEVNDDDRELSEV